MPMNARLLRPANSFTPRSIPGLQLWMDVTRLSSLTFNGGSVSQANDLSGNGRHFRRSGRLLGFRSQAAKKGRGQNGVQTGGHGRDVNEDGHGRVQGKRGSNSSLPRAMVTWFI